jgi:hypothetical protein
VRILTDNKIHPVRPLEMTNDEFYEKLQYARSILQEHDYTSVFINSEGGMRWLTGLRHQVADISPKADSPVRALVRIGNEDKIKISIISSPYEMPRLKEQIPAIFEILNNIEYEFLTNDPIIDAKTLNPIKNNYNQIIDRIIRPLIGGFTGNQYKKLDWLSNMTMKALTETANELRIGMDGQTVRGLLIYNLASYGIETNVVLIALKGQEKHLHPLPCPLYKTENDSWNKLVVGSRFAEHIVSQSIMVKLGGGITEQEKLIYMALQDATVEYADCYRENSEEKNIFKEMSARFSKVGKKYGLKKFENSAFLHHPGGGTSPLGNRDWMLNPKGEKNFEAWTQFAINPVDYLAGFKVEVQGIVQPGGKPPFMLDMFKYIPDGRLNYRAVKSEFGTQSSVPELLIL